MNPAVNVDGRSTKIGKVGDLSTALTTEVDDLAVKLATINASRSPFGGRFSTTHISPIWGPLKKKLATLPINAKRIANKCAMNCHPTNECAMNCHPTNECAMNCQIDFPSNRYRAPPSRCGLGGGRALPVQLALEGVQQVGVQRGGGCGGIPADLLLLQMHP